MFRLQPDQHRPGRYRITYYPLKDSKEFLYGLENLEWDSLKDHIQDTVKDPEELYWIHDVMRLSNKNIVLSDLGEWSAF